MRKAYVTFKKLFGSGPVGVSLSLALFFIAWWFKKRLPLPLLSNNRVLLDIVFYISIFIAASIILWSVKSLPATDRGNKLCTTGAFRYVRHPLYAAFLSVFNFGLAIWLNSWIFILWAVLLHPIWHFVIRSEEKYMIELFGQSYIAYGKKTGRFFPRLL